MSIPDELQSVLVADPETLSGAVRFKKTRVPVQALIDILDAGQSIDEFLDGCPNDPRAYAVAIIHWEQNFARQTFGLETAN